MSKKPQPPAGLSPQARQEWLQAVEDVEPYLQAYATPALPVAREPAAKETSSTRFIPLALPKADSEHLWPLQCGESRGLDGASLRRLKRGQMPIDAMLDLHGMTQPEAREALTAAIWRASAKGHKLLLVITGKGSLSQQGVLKSQLPRWLNDEALRPYLLAFHPARREDGGSGAFYVLLKTKRTGRHDG